jgi:hypothetical protein
VARAKRRCPGNLDELFELCVPEPNTGCWLWDGDSAPGGYGRAFRDGKRVLVHRLSAELSEMTIAGLCVCHRCDTPACCNPAPPFVGPQAANVQDMMSKGRGPQRSATCFMGHRKVERGGRQVCRECQARHMRSFRARGVR